MTPQQKLKHAILIRQHEMYPTDPLPHDSITGDEIDALYEKIDNAGNLGDAKEEVRTCGNESSILFVCPPGYHMAQRNYECDEVAYQTPHGWVGYTYWYGGGKHSEPSAIEWMAFSYDLDCKEKPITIIQQTFTKVA